MFLTWNSALFLFASAFFFMATLAMQKGYQKTNTILFKHIDMGHRIQIFSKKQDDSFNKGSGVWL